MITLLLLAHFTFAQVPTVTPEFFQVGQSWTWDFIDPEGKPYSTETYRVTKINKGYVTFTMSTVYPDGRDYQEHHKFNAFVQSCLNKYKFRNRTWSIQMFYKDQRGNWKPVQVGKTAAFEEKFNCNPKIQTASTRTATPGQIFQQNRRGSWYLQEGPNAAVAFEKLFSPASPEHYTMRLRL